MAGGLMPSWNLQPHFLTGDDSLGPEKQRQKQKMTLFDPFCGSGTIAIEGASLQMGLPPGRFRPPPLEGTAFYNSSLWEEMKSKALSVSRKDSLQVAAGDIDQKALDAAKSNARKAGVDGCIDFVKGSFVLHPLLKDPKGENASQSLLVVANPPYGKRLSLSSSHKTTQSNIYRKLAKAISSISTSSRKVDYAIIGKDMRIMRESGMPLDVAFSTKQGGLNVAVMIGSLSPKQS
jgi:23S rRNA G2445 N2-methylase RlmL